MNQVIDRRTLFLEEFIKRTIISSSPKPVEILGKKVKLVPTFEIKKLDLKIQQREREFSQQEKIEKTQTIAAPKVPEVKIIQEIPKLPEIPKTPEMPKAQEILPKKPILERLAPIIADSNVQGINCPGPDKIIQIITLTGITQNTSLSFTESEINDFMKDISEKTRIPLTPGVFKVFYQNLTITAVISEFIGTRFIIEKRQITFSPAARPAVTTPIRAQFR